MLTSKGEGVREMSTIAYVINLSTREDGIRNPQNHVNVVYYFINMVMRGFWQKL